MIVHAHNLEEFNKLIAKGNVLVDFFATWCGPCQMLAPNLEKIDREVLAGDLTIVKVDVDEVGVIAARFGIQSIPTLILFRNGEQVKHALGYMPVAQLLQFLK